MSSLISHLSLSSTPTFPRSSHSAIPAPSPRARVYRSSVVDGRSSLSCREVVLPQQRGLYRRWSGNEAEGKRIDWEKGR